jgi:hypothetical protein
MASQRLTDKSGLAQQTAADDLLMVVDASVSLSSAQIQALHTTPIQLLPAPGSGFITMIHSVLVDCTYVSTTQTQRRTGQIAYGTPATFANEIFRVDSWMWNKTADETRRAGPGFAQNTNADNTAVNIAADASILGDFTAVVHLAYTIIKI